MPPKSISKSNPQRRRRSKFVPKPTRNWLDLPSDLTRNILERVGVIDRLENAQKVCTAWREICKDPAMWRVVRMDVYACVRGYMFKNVVDRSQGQLVDLTIIGVCNDNDDLLQYIVERSSQLRRLEIVQYAFDLSEMRSEAFKNLPLLEELSLVNVKISKQDIEAAGHYCPLLKTLKVNKKAPRSGDAAADDEIALAIGKNLSKLTHLELIGNSSMTDTGVQAILDGCCHLESLDLRRCKLVDLAGDLAERCHGVCRKLPHDSLEGFAHSSYGVCDSDSDSEFISGGEYDQYSDYDDYTAYNNYVDNLSGISLESLGEVTVFMSMFDE